MRFSKKASVLFFNSGVMALSTFITASTFYLAFPGTDLRHGFTPNLFVGLCMMALLQYVLNSAPVAASVALKVNQTVWQSWRTNFLWTSLTYFAGAIGAAIVGRLSENYGFFAFVATAPIIVIVYFTYRTYLTNVETSASQAEQAKLHVEELNKYIGEQKRISQALVESEEHFRNAFDYAPIGMALVSPKGNWLRVNRSLSEIVGYSEAELLTGTILATTSPRSTECSQAKFLPANWKSVTFTNSDTTCGLRAAHRWFATLRASRCTSSSRFRTSPNANAPRPRFTHSPSQTNLPASTTGADFWRFQNSISIPFTGQTKVWWLSTPISTA
jgi:PAS domain-containing protein